MALLVQRPSDPNRRPYPERPQIVCPKCDSERVRPAPLVNPASEMVWFQCDACGHLWALRRDPAV